MPTFYSRMGRANSIMYVPLGFQTKENMGNALGFIQKLIAQILRFVTTHNLRHMLLGVYALRPSTFRMRKIIFGWESLTSLTFQTFFDRSDSVFTNNARCIREKCVRHDTCFLNMWQAVALGFISYFYTLMGILGFWWCVGTGTRNYGRTLCRFSMPKRAYSMVCFLILCHTVSAMPLTSQEVSIPYTRSSIFGSALPCHLVSYVEDMLDNRLSDSSWRTVQGGMKIWKEVAEQERWSTILHTDDPDRGPKLVTFVCHMLQDTSLVWGSIESYVWGVRTWMMLQHQADPLMGVLGWQHFAKAARILSWVPNEPRKRVPAEQVRKMAADTDLTSFVDVQQTFLQLVLLYTFSRTECPCPKTFTGRQSYDEAEHWSVADFVVGLCRAGSTLIGMWVRFKRIKQDPRVEREEAKGDGDWAFVGDIPGSDLSILYWYRKLMGLMGVRPKREEAFFLDPDGTRPLLYHKALAQFKDRQRRIGVKEEDLAGLHGLRVEGYNGCESALGDEVAAAHGLWKSKCSKRYARFAMELIATIPAWIVGEKTSDPSTSNSDHLDNGQERDARAPKQRMNRRGMEHNVESQQPGGSLQNDDPESDSEPEVPNIENTCAAPVGDLLPHNWVMEQRCTSTGRVYKVYVGPEGQKAQSRLHAWRVHEASRTVEEPVGSEEVEAELRVQTRAPMRDVAESSEPPPRPDVTPSSVRKSLAQRLTERRELSPWLRGRFTTREGSPDPNADENPDGENPGAPSLAKTRPERSQAAKNKPDRFVSRE